MKKCPNCRKKITGNKIFCPYCGEQLRDGKKDELNDKEDSPPPWFDPRGPL